MTQGKSQFDESSGSGPTSGQSSLRDDLRSESTPITPGSAATIEFTEKDSSINKELRRLNRSWHVLSACNQALAQAFSEQELLQQICDVIVQMGAYRFAWIGYAEPDAGKTVRPMAHAGYEAGYLSNIRVAWSDELSGRGPTGTAIRENRACVIADVENDPRFLPWRDAAVQR